MLFARIARASLVFVLSLAANAHPNAPPSKRTSGCTIRYGSLHINTGSSNWGWLDKGSGVGGTFKVIASGIGVESNQGVFYYRDCGDHTQPVVIYVSVCAFFLGWWMDV